MRGTAAGSPRVSQNNLDRVDHVVRKRHGNPVFVHCRRILVWLAAFERWRTALGEGGKSFAEIWAARTELHGERLIGKML